MSCLFKHLKKKNSGSHHSSFCFPILFVRKENIFGGKFQATCMSFFRKERKYVSATMLQQMLLAHWYDFFVFQKFIVLTVKTSFLATVFSFSLYVAYEKLWTSLLTISDTLFIKNVLGFLLQFKNLTKFSLNFSALVLERHCPWSLHTSH